MGKPPKLSNSIILMRLRSESIVRTRNKIEPFFGNNYAPFRRSEPSELRSLEKGIDKPDPISKI